jgi:hypothetical protein
MLLGLLLLAAPPVTLAQDSSGIGYRMSATRPDGGPVMPRLRVGTNFQNAGVSERGSWNARFRAALDLVSRDDRNTEDSFAELAAGYRWLLANPPSPDINDTTAIDRATNPMLGIYLDGRYESNQALTEQLGSGQVRLIFTHTAWDGLMLLLPQAELAVGLTRSVASAVRDALGTGDETNQRIEAEALWRVNFGRFVKGPLENLWLFAELRAFRTDGLGAPLESFGFSEGSYLALRARLDVRVFGADGVFVQWARGRLPAQPTLFGDWQVGLRK